MIRYVKYQSASRLAGANGKWFLRVKNSEMLNLDDLAEHMAAHNSPYSKGVIVGMLTDMVNCIKEILLDGKSVKLSDLAIFSLGVHCKGTDTAEEATPSIIKSLSFNARGTGKLSTKKLTTEVRFKEQAEYSVEAPAAATPGA